MRHALKVVGKTLAGPAAVDAVAGDAEGWPRFGPNLGMKGQSARRQRGGPTACTSPGISGVRDRPGLPVDVDRGDRTRGQHLLGPVATNGLVVERPDDCGMILDNLAEFID